MPNIKSATEIAQKWGRVTPQRREDYEKGVQNPKKDWEQSTTAAASNYAQGVQNAISNGLFEKGVRSAGSQKWKENAVKLGSRRWPEGVSAAQDAYAKGFAPYAQVIASTTLPERFPRRDPRNMDRAAAMAQALARAKEQGV